MDFTTAILSLGVISVVMLIIEVNFTYATQGLAFGWSSNRPQVEYSDLAMRIKNSYNNQVESISYTLPVLVAAALLGVEHAGAETAALFIVIGRAIYGPLYYTGIPYARLIGFGMATVSTLYLIFILVSYL